MDQILETFRGTGNILYNHAKLKKGRNCYNSRHYSIQVSGNPLTKDVVHERMDSGKDTC
jgi:hypothetical protein